MKPRALYLLVMLTFGCRTAEQPREFVSAPDKPTTEQKMPVQKYDQEGIRMPAADLPMGTPVPLGLEEVSTGKGWVRFSGYIESEEVIAFYRKYLTLPEGTAPHESGRSTLFRNARPRQPGNPGREVEVRVIPEQKGSHTAVLILDQSFANREKLAIDPDKLPKIQDLDIKPGEKLPEDFL